MDLYLNSDKMRKFIDNLYFGGLLGTSQCPTEHVDHMHQKPVLELLMTRQNSSLGLEAQL